MLLIAALCASCATGYSATTSKPAKLWMHAVDATGTGLGLAIAVDAYTRHSTTQVERGATAITLLALFWLPYWFVRTGSR